MKNPILRTLIAAWTEIEPTPRVVSRPAPIIIGLMLFGIGHAFVYRWLSPVWPSGITAKAARLAALIFLIFLLSFVFWEFFTPFNQFNEPFLLIGLELIFWAVIAIAEALTIASVMALKINL